MKRSVSLMSSLLLIGSLSSLGCDGDREARGPSPALEEEVPGDPEPTDLSEAEYKARIAKDEVEEEMRVRDEEDE